MFVKKIGGALMQWCRKNINLVMWIFPMLTIIANVIIISIFINRGSFEFFNILWILSGIVPIFGVTLSIMYCKRLFIVNTILLITFNIILFLPFILWSFLLIIGIAFGGTLGISASRRYNNYIIISALCYICFVVAWIVRKVIRSTKNKKSNIRNIETSNID